MDDIFLKNGFPTVIVDNGSDTMKVGFSGEDTPQSIFPTIVGFSRVDHLYATNFGLKPAYVGDEAIKKRGILGLRYPVVDGFINNLQNMEEIWNYTFTEELKVLPGDQPVLMIDSSSNDDADNYRASIAEMVFESLQVPAFNVSNQDVLSCYAVGCTSGIVINSGKTTTRIVPIHSGISLPRSAKKLNIGGDDVRDLFIQQLAERPEGIVLTTRQELCLAEEIIRKIAFVAGNFAEETDLHSRALSRPEETYALPDGTVLTVGGERFNCTEALFQPRLADLGTCAGVPELIPEVISQLDPKIQAEMYQNIIIAGGNTMYPGFVDRLKAELVALAPPNTSVRLIAPSDRHLAPWIGGSILSSLSVFKNMLVTKQEYEEIGCEAIRQRCV